MFFKALIFLCALSACVIGTFTAMQPLTGEEAVEKAARCLGYRSEVAVGLREALTKQKATGTIHIVNGTLVAPTRFSCGTKESIPRASIPFDKDPISILEVVVRDSDGKILGIVTILAVQMEARHGKAPTFLIRSNIRSEGPVQEDGPLIIFDEIRITPSPRAPRTLRYPC